MISEKQGLERKGAAWLDFWFMPPPLHNMAILRIGWGLMLLYMLLVRSYDLEMQMASRLLGDPAVMTGLDQMALPFSFFNWLDQDWWLWSVHFGAIVAAVAFTLGVTPTVSGALTLAFLMSYAHRNPAVVLPLDGLLMLGLAYLILMPTGLKVSVPGGQIWPQPKSEQLVQATAEQPPAPWSGLVMRAFQLHLCILYFQSGLARLNAAWLGGMALWHPRLVENGAPFAPETLRDSPYLLSLIPTGMALFELFYGVLIWVPWLRYPVLAVAVVVHLSVGIVWDKMAFNMLMIVFGIAFIPPAHLGFVCEQTGLLLRQGWRSMIGETREEG